MTLLNPGYHDESELASLGFAALGKNVRIGKNSTFSGVERISIGSNVRIDGNVTFACNTGRIRIGSFVHIGGNSHLSGSGEISIGDFCTISQGVRIYSASDDYSGMSLTNATTPDQYRNETRSPVVLRDHVILGSGSVVLPGVMLNEGAAVGALSLVKSDLDEWSIYAGAPAKKIKERSRKLLEHKPANLLN